MTEAKADLTALDVRAHEAVLQQKVADILAEARRQGATAAEVSVSEDIGLGVSVRMGELETVEFNQDRGFGITLYSGQRRGSAATSDSRQEAIAETVAAAMAIARQTEPDPAAGLADAALMPKSLPDLDLYHGWQLTPEAAEDLARRAEAAGLAVDERIRNSDGAHVSTQQSCRVYGNSHGFIGSYVATRHGLNTVLIAADEHGMQRDHWYTVARSPEQLEVPETVGRIAAERAVARLSPRKARTGRFPVVFSAQMASGLVSHLLGALSGSALYRHASFLPDSLGTQVASDHLSLQEAPHLRGAIGSAAFDGDGVATRAKHFINQGLVENYLLGVYSARKLGLETTGNAGGVHNLTLDGAERPFAALLADVGEGLYVTELMGQGVNSVTGDYSRGAAGYWIENGELAYPVAEITIASNLKDMWRQIPCIGDDYDLRGNIRTPSVLVEQMAIAGS